MPGELTQEHRTILKEITRKLLAAREDIVAIVAFGSFVKGGSYEDIDLLIVLEELPQEKHNEEYLALQRIAGGPPLVPLDLCLYSRDGAVVNFEDHMPLFLDIAFDGVVLHDTGGFIKGLIEETQNYVVAKGIQRLEGGGWRFPVKYREATPLSKIDNEVWANLWLEEAEEDLKGARQLLDGGVSARCHMLCQQAIEKAVKSVLACFGLFIPSHYVGKILDREIPQRNLGAEGLEKRDLVAIYAQDLEPDATKSRYPGEMPDRIWIPKREYTAETASKALEKAEYSFRTSQEFCRWWFRRTEQPPTNQEG